MIDNVRIISFSGRKESGKTTLAMICVEQGYELRSFGTALKKLVCDATGIPSIDELNSFKTSPMGVIVDTKVLDVIERETGIDREYIKNTSGKLTELSTARDWLQVIGTDVIRSADPDWHVRKTLETLEDDKCYVFDDTRFPNESNALRELDAECWFIIRTKTDNISNHPSENSLHYTDFNQNVIVNDTSLEEFQKRWKLYLLCHEITKPLREWTINEGGDIPNLLSDTTLRKFFVYRNYLQTEQPLIPEVLKENNTHTGFVGIANPFLMETLKEFYVA